MHSENNNTSDAPYSIFDRRQKWLIIIIASTAATCESSPTARLTVSNIRAVSGFASNIYFPAIPTIANDLGVSLELVNLSVTTYLIFQGLAPSLWGPISDVKGRRIAYICTFIVFFCACIGLAETKNYATLVIVRSNNAQRRRGLPARERASPPRSNLLHPTMPFYHSLRVDDPVPRQNTHRRPDRVDIHNRLDCCIHAVVDNDVPCGYISRQECSSQREFEPCTVSVCGWWDELHHAHDQWRGRWRGVYCLCCCAGCRVSWAFGSVEVCCWLEERDGAV